MPNSSPPPFVSSRVAARPRLTNGQRFLSQSLAHSLRTRVRTPRDFVRHFSPAEIIESLAKHDDRRALLIEKTTGMKRSIALHQSLSSAAEGLRLGLEHGEIEPATVVENLDADLLVAHLPAPKIWRFLVEARFWLVGPRQEHEFEAAKHFMSCLMTAALSEKLIGPDELVARITPQRLALSLPREALAPMMDVAFAAGRESGRLSGEAVLAIAPPTVLAEHVTLSHLWRSVFVEKISSDQQLEGGYPADDDEVTVRRSSENLMNAAADASSELRADKTPDLDGVLCDLPNPSGRRSVSRSAARVGKTANG